jgi:Secretion system C-terminal sorting domain
MWLFRCIFCWLLLLPGMVQGQFNNNYWVFGDSASIDWTNPALPQIIKVPVDSRGDCSSFKDTSGTRVYSCDIGNTLPRNGVVINRYGTLFQNGDSLKGTSWYHDRLILPDPGNDSLIYVINAGVTQSGPYGLYYSKANYKANNDTGIVLQKNVQLNNLPAFDGLTAVRHGNGRDWWIVSQRWVAPTFTVPVNDFYIFHLSTSPLSTPIIQNIGLAHTTNAGQVLFNKDGSKFVMISLKGLIQICDFDRCTGQIIFCDSLQAESPGPSYPTLLSSCAFSTDERFLYICEFSQSAQPSIIWQYDLTASNILASKDSIGGFNEYYISPYSLLLAPDGKIYLSSGDDRFGWPYPDTSIAYTQVNMNLSVINQPDSLGLACDFQPFSFYLGGARTYYGLPNNPDYELGAWVGSPCDTLSVGLNPNPIPEASWMQAWYNHEWDMIHVNASKLQGKKGVLRLFDMQGRMVFEKQADVISGGYFTTEINMSGLANGVYMVNLVTEKEKISGKVGKY